jgi:hypothetical protein
MFAKTRRTASIMRAACGTWTAPLRL